ncbi:MAG: TIM barrel protein [Candidatus Hinthialibacter antarcticus]|nr:TIM barrel protein [Candidatus Hinthialibacter antarcticus]
MCAIQVANAPCSWGVLEFNLEGEAAGYSTVLDEMLQSNYAGTELGDWGFMPTDPDLLRQELQSRNLALLGAFVPVALVNPDAHQDGVATALRIAKLLAAVNESPFIVLADDNGTVEARTQKAGRIQPEDGLSDAQWSVFARGADTIAKAVKEETGVRTVFHHHCAGFVETPDEIERLLSLTDPESLGLCFDTGHFEYGGGNAAEGLKTFADRIWHVHFKDCHPKIARKACEEHLDYFKAVGNGVFCELGKGSVDFPAVLKILNGLGYEDWIVVEQDVLPGMGSPLDSALRNREYLKSLGI